MLTKLHFHLTESGAGVCSSHALADGGCAGLPVQRTRPYGKTCTRVCHERMGLQAASLLWCFRRQSQVSFLLVYQS